MILRIEVIFCRGVPEFIFEGSAEIESGNDLPEISVIGKTNRGRRKELVKEDRRRQTENALVDPVHASGRHFSKNIRSILAASTKSLSVSPLILCVYVIASTRPQARHRSGWCPSASATAPTRFTKSSALLKSGNRNVFFM